jgi:hypothetical protein
LAARKKSQVAQERDEGARGLWRWFLTRFDLRRLVFVDESGMHIAMDRSRARAPKGERAYGKVPGDRGKNPTLLASMSLSGMGEAMCVEGATDAEAFEVYVEHFLARTLEEMGKWSSSTTSERTSPRESEGADLEARGAEVLFLPSYSPDL